MDVLIAKSVFLLVTIGAFVVSGRILRHLLKLTFAVEKPKMEIKTLHILSLD